MNNNLIKIIRNAGNLILDNRKGLTRLKGDSSPVTQADFESNIFLTQELRKIKDIPVLSEENIIEYDERKKWKEFWLIDPLDGTKEFIRGYKDFCINIALIKNQSPILGLIYAPLLDELYFAEKDKGFTFYGERHQKEHLLSKSVAISRFHHSSLTQEFMRLNTFKETHITGAAIKFGHLACGIVGYYPRFQGSMEWDIAAGQIILQEAGGTILDLETNQPPLYNKENLLNNHFISYAPHLPKTEFIFPKY